MYIHILEKIIVQCHNTHRLDAWKTFKGDIP